MSAPTLKMGEVVKGSAKEAEPFTIMPKEFVSYFDGWSLKAESITVRPESGQVVMLPGNVRGLITGVLDVTRTVRVEWNRLMPSEREIILTIEGPVG